MAIIAAMTGELKPLVRGWQHERRNGVDLWRWVLHIDEGEDREWVAACAGAGVDRATRAIAEIECDGAIDMLISAGWAGALSDQFAPGKVYRASGVIDARTGESYPAAGWLQECWVVTSPKVADAREKARLASSYGAGLVDMEAAGVARLAAMRGIPFYCTKGISDGFRDRLPDFNRFISEKGQFQRVRFILYALIRPWQWPSLMRMGENSSKAAQGIKESVLEILRNEVL